MAPDYDKSRLNYNIDQSGTGYPELKWETISKKSGAKKKEGTYRRSTLHVILLHIAIRVRYFLESWFFLKPLLSSKISAKPSFLRPKDFPQLDWSTLFFLRVFFLLGSVIRGLPRVLFFILIKLLVLHAMNWFIMKLQNRIARKMRESSFDFDKVKAMEIPEYDWKNGSPEEFYELYVKHSHPVVLRGFMKDTPLLKEYTMERLIEKYGEEVVPISRPGADGGMGKLKDVLTSGNY